MPDEDLRSLAQNVDKGIPMPEGDSQSFAPRNSYRRGRE